MTSLRLSLALVAALAGCQALEKKPPPETAEVPPELAEGPEAGEEEPVEAEPPAVETVDPAPVAPVPVAPPRQEIPGSWTSSLAQGPGSAAVRRVHMTFGPDGAYAGAALVEVDGQARYVPASGGWTLAGDILAVTDPDGRERRYVVAWDGAVLVLRDGEALLRLERDPE
ncbi:MAG: hypothetical protein HUU15_01295 [Candidatus Brocadiae bacterium]|nr:hypothetical protein [Candidatus Brocadiia bacterium]